MLYYTIMYYTILYYTIIIMTGFGEKRMTRESDGGLHGKGLWLRWCHRALAMFLLARFEGVYLNKKVDAIRMC